MPGLLRGIARTAVVAGTATAVSNRVSRRQASRWAAEDQSSSQQPHYAQPAYPQQGYAPAPPAPAGVDVISQLRDLAALRDQGILTDEEFATQKARILSA
jgi:hypothetical protein